MPSLTSHTVIPRWVIGHAGHDGRQGRIAASRELSEKFLPSPTLSVQAYRPRCSDRNVTYDATPEVADGLTDREGKIGRKYPWQKDRVALLK